MSYLFRILLVLVRSNNNIKKMQEEYSKRTTTVTKDFNSMEITIALFKHKYIILGITFVGIIVSVIVSLMLPNWYMSTASVVPPKTSESLMEGALGNISSALKNFGLTKLGKSGAESGYSYMVILESRTLKDSLIDRFNLAEEYDIPDTLRSLIYKELDTKLHISSEAEGNFLISILSKDRRKARDMTVFFVEKANEFTLQLFYDEAKVNLEYAEKRLGTTDSALNAISAELQEFSKQKQLFSPLDQASAVAKSIGELKAEAMKQELVYEMIVNRFGANDPYSQSQHRIVETINKKLYDAENKPGFAGNFALTEAPEIGIQYIRMFAMFEAYTQLKAFLLPIVEENRLAEKRRTRSFYYVDYPNLPDKKAEPKRSLIVAGSAIGSFVIAVLFVLVIYGISNFRKKYNQAIETSEQK